MTGQQTIDEGALAGIAFAGRTLGPFFRYDPLLDREKVEALYVALARSDAAALCEEWPFVTPDEALKPIADMVRGAKRLEDELAVDNESLAATSSLADEYRRLFVGPAKKAAPPWGLGIHRPRPGRLRSLDSRTTRMATKERDTGPPRRIRGTRGPHRDDARAHGLARG